MRELLDDLDRWRRDRVRATLARVVDLDGSAQAPDAAMAVSERGEVVGSVYSGCVERALVAEALRVLEMGRPRLVTFGYSDDQAYSVGLTCGGRIHVFLEPLDW